LWHLLKTKLFKNFFELEQFVEILKYLLEYKITGLFGQLLMGKGGIGNGTGGIC
jgi:hypothetical protein